MLRHVARGGLAAFLVASCGKVNTAGPQCPDEITCLFGQECVDGRCVAGTAGDGGAGDAGQVVTFVDDEASDFEAGALENLEFDGDRLRLGPDLLVGQMESRVFDAGASARWPRIRWTPARPYGKPLADGRGQDVGYEAGRIDMAENVLLLHFDDTDPLASGASAADSSGRGNDALVTTDRPVDLVAGVFATAVDDTVPSRLAVNGASPDLQFGAEDFTWSVWIKASAPCQESDSNDAYIGGEELASPRTHVWTGCLLSTGTSCAPGSQNGRPAAVVCSNQPDDCVILCGTSNLPDGRWHHLAMRKSGHPDTEVTLWFDGQVEGRGTTKLADVLAFADGTDLGVGHFAAPPARDTDAQGALDELAIWRRGLSDDELRDLHLRGAVRLRFQARICEEPDCSDDPAFVGPDGSSASFYEDATDAPAAAAVDLEGLAEGRYFQYRAEFETLATAPSPELLRVEVDARP